MLKGIILALALIVAVTGDAAKTPKLTLAGKTTIAAAA